jgi:aldehyde:ferredoxin oxidoreductase
MTINREGFGDTLADGVKRASEKIGKDSEKYAVHAGGQELPMHDSRLDPGFAIAYQCEPTPGRHTISGYLYASLYGAKQKFPEARRMVRRAKGKDAKNVQRYTTGTFYMQLLNCSGMCMFGALTSSLPVVEYLNAVTGWDLSPDEYFRIGERILSLRKAFNMREGVKTEDQKLNDRAVGKPPLSKGPLKGVTINMDSLQRQFFETVGWDPAKGGPTQEKMKELGIDSLFS